MPRRPVPRPLTAEELAAPESIPRERLLQLDPDELWRAGWRVLAAALDETVEFRFSDVLTVRQVSAATELRRKLGAAAAPARKGGRR